MNSQDHLSVKEQWRELTQEKGVTIEDFENIAMSAVPGLELNLTANKA
jgi:tRNA A37 threonylcarbamoyltransferase TsaD